MGVSLAAWHSGVAAIAKLGIHCLKSPTRPKNELIFWVSIPKEPQHTWSAVVSSCRSFRACTRSVVRILGPGLSQMPRYTQQDCIGEL